MGLFRKGSGQRRGPEGGSTSGAGTEDIEHKPTGEAKSLPRWIQRMSKEGPEGKERARAVGLYRQQSELERFLLVRFRDDTSGRFKSTLGEGMPTPFSPKKWAGDEEGVRLATEYQEVDEELERLRQRYDLAGAFTPARQVRSEQQPSSEHFSSWHYLESLFDTSKVSRMTEKQVIGKVAEYLREYVEELKKSVNKLHEVAIQLRGLAELESSDLTNPVNRLRADVNRNRVLANRRFAEVEEQYEWSTASRNKGMVFLAQKNPEIKTLFEGVNNILRYRNDLSKEIEGKLGIQRRPDE